MRKLCKTDVNSQLGGGGSEPRLAFTLTEVVITMLVISIVVGVTIRVTKTKLDSIVSYNYYSAYEVIKNVTDKLLSEYNPEKDSYKISFLNKIRSALKTPVFIPKSYAEGEPEVIYTCAAASCSNNTNFIVKQPIASSYESLDCSQANYCYEGSMAYYFEKCPGKYIGIHPEDNNTLENAKKWFDYQDRRDTYIYKGPVEEACNRSCGDENNNCGSHMILWSEPWKRFISLGNYKGETKICTFVDYDISENEYGTFDERRMPYNKWPVIRCVVSAPAVCEKSCLPTQYLDKDLCQCKSLPMTIPKHDFCKEFESKVNTRALLTRDNIDEYCKGDAISEDTTDFSGKKPDLILPNGMKIYNISQPYGVITGLENNIEGSKFKIIKDDGTSEEIDTNRYGYIAYVDIDGKNSDSILWYDVYPFYITLSGKVIPAYDTSHPGESGGDSTFHLEVSIKDIMQFGRDSWYYRSISFREGACRAGYVGGNYCSENGESYTADDRCLSDDTDCRIKAIRPMRFLGKSFN